MATMISNTLIQTVNTESPFSVDADQSLDNPHTDPSFTPQNQSSARRETGIAGFEPLRLENKSQSVSVESIKQDWNSPPINRWRMAVIMLAQFNFGVNDASYGALLPSIASYYGNLSYTVVSLTFFSPFAGYTVSAIMSDWLLTTFGQRGLAIVSPLARLVAYAVVAAHPPFGAVVAILSLSGLGCGLIDSGWNSWIGDMKHANESLGISNSFYGVGAIVGPVIVTTLVDRYGIPWYWFYVIETGLVCIELLLLNFAFWDETGSEFRCKNAYSASQQGRTKQALKEPVTWICAAILFTYTGVEVSLGGWIVTYMTQARHGQPFASTLVSTGFWIGLTVGRILLGFAIPYVGERKSVTICIALAILFEALFWQLQSFTGSAIAVALLGFSIGPLFMTPMVAAARLLPKQLHVGAIGFGTALGGSGAAIVPFAVGAVINATSLNAFHVVISIFLGLHLLLWYFLPPIPKDDHKD